MAGSGVGKIYIGNKYNPRDEGLILKYDASQGQFCQRCNAWRGSLGLEPDPDLFISHLVQVFREVRRVLHPSGVCFVNLGDSYASSGTGNDGNEGYNDGRTNRTKRLGGRSVSGLKPKDLCMIPARVALSLQADGWWLRSAMPWVKRSAMPESVTDRPASALEYVYMFTKSSKYFFDMEAVRVDGPKMVRKGKGKPLGGVIGEGRNDRENFARDIEYSGRNFRNTDLFFESIKEPHGLISAGDEMVGLDINPQAMKEAHFATFPEKLVDTCIKAGSSERGCCPECLESWVRVVEKGELIDEYNGRNLQPHQTGKDFQQNQTMASGLTKGGFIPGHRIDSTTIGWAPGCKCGLDPIPCTVMDIFFGAGTSGVVAERLDRNWIGIELNPDYAKIAKNRIEKARDPGAWKQVEQDKVTGQATLFNNQLLPEVAKTRTADFRISHKEKR